MIFKTSRQNKLRFTLFVILPVIDQFVEIYRLNTLSLNPHDVIARLISGHRPRKQNFL